MQINMHLKCPCDLLSLKFNCCIFTYHSGVAAEIPNTTLSLGCCVCESTCTHECGLCTTADETNNLVKKNWGIVYNFCAKICRTQHGSCGFAPVNGFAYLWSGQPLQINNNKQQRSAYKLCLQELRCYTPCELSSSN